MKTIEVTLGNKEIPVIYGVNSKTKNASICYNIIDNDQSHISHPDDTFNIPEEKYIAINFSTSESISNLINELSRLHEYMVALEVYNDYVNGTLYKPINE